MKELIRLINLPRDIEAICITTDGFYMGREFGDIGFNRFFGKPSHHAGPGRNMSIRTWKSYSFNERRKALIAARIIGVKVRNFLPKENRNEKARS